MSSKGRIYFAVAVLSFVALGGLYFALRVWMPFMWAVLAPTVIGFLGWAYEDRRAIKDFLTMKTTKYGIDMGAIIFLSLLFLAVINFVGARHVKTFDFSVNQINTLSDQSKKMALSLSELSVKFFYKFGADRVEENKKLFRDLVKKYQDVNPKIQIEFIEINEKAKLAQDYNATKGSGEAFIDYKGRKNRIENYTEQDFTNAIIKVTREKKKTVYFLEGHGERSIELEKDENSVFGFKQLLEKNSYEVKKISLISNKDFPEEVDVLVLAAPIQNFQDHEILAIENYLKKGGALFLAIDKAQKMPNAVEKILKHVGLEIEPFYVFNVFNTPLGQVVNAQSPTVAVVYSAQSEITRVFSANQMTVFRQPHALKEAAHDDQIKIDFIVKTPESSVALKDLDSSDYLGKPQSYNIVAEVSGKLPGAEKSFNAIVTSDIDFMTNILLYQNLNRDLALNSISALARDFDLVSVTPKEIVASKILLSPPEFNQFFKFIIIGVFLPLPIVFMIISLVLWFRRRHS